MSDWVRNLPTKTYNISGTVVVAKTLHISAGGIHTFKTTCSSGDVKIDASFTLAADDAPRMDVNPVALQTAFDLHRTNLATECAWKVAMHAAATSLT